MRDLENRSSVRISRSERSTLSHRDRSALNIANPLGRFGDEVFHVTAAGEVIEGVAPLKEDAQRDHATVEGVRYGFNHPFKTTRRAKGRVQVGIAFQLRSHSVGLARSPQERPQTIHYDHRQQAELVPT